MDKAYFEELKGYFKLFRTLPEHNIQELFDEIDNSFVENSEPTEPITLEPVAPVKPKKVKAESK